MGGMNFRDAYEYDPETFGGESGGLSGMLRRTMQQRSLEPRGVNFGPTPGAAPEYNLNSYSSLQGGLLGRLQALQAEQNRYRSVAESNGQTPSEPADPNFRQISRGSSSASLPTPGYPVPQASTLQTQAQYEADQAQQARDVAAVRLSRGVKNLARVESPPPDPVDMLKSAGVGLANGSINAIGFPADLLTGFGYLPNNFAINLALRRYGFTPLPADSPDYLGQLRAEAMRRWIKSHVGEFYQPQTRAGRYMETIGEMAPMVLGGEAVGVVRGVQAAGAALRELPAILAKHAVVPGMAVQALEEALPDSGAGQALQKAYPVLRRALPVALAAKRYLGRPVAPNGN